MRVREGAAEAVREDGAVAAARAAAGKVLAALEKLPQREAILFPASEGGRIAIDTWRSREWSPALKAADEGKGHDVGTDSGGEPPDEGRGGLESD